jgi:hypothetical protein
MPEPTFGSLGDSLDDAVRTEFFSWFGLLEDDRDLHPDGTAVVRFKSPGDHYHQWTTCRVSIQDNQLTNQITLSVDSVFIDSTEVWQLARDITRSFIDAALVNQSDADQVQEIIRDLLYRPQAGAKRAPVNAEEVKAAIYRGERVFVRRGGSGDIPELPAVVSRGFAVYIGDRELFARDLSNTWFRMQNLQINGRRMLEVSFDRITNHNENDVVLTS